MKYWITAGLIAIAPAIFAAEDERNWSANAELGYVDTSGNTKTTSVKARLGYNYEIERWRYQAGLDALNTEERGVRSAERYFGSNKLDYKYSERGYVFGFASYERDRFSGYEYQAVGAAGWGYRVLNRPNMTWDIEAGPGYRLSKLEDSAGGGDEDEFIVRGFTRYLWQLSESARFGQEVSVESGSDNTITRSITSLTTNIIGALALKATYTIKYTDDVPPGTRHMDREAALTLVYTF